MPKWSKKRIEKAEENQPGKGGAENGCYSMKQLLEAGVHFGHQTRRWNPKMAPISLLKEMVSTLLTYKNRKKGC